MELQLDGDVRAAAEFVQTVIAEDRRVAVAKALANLAPLLWGHRDSEAAPAKLVEAPISLADRNTQPSSTESSLA